MRYTQEPARQELLQVAWDGHRAQFFEELDHGVLREADLSRSWELKYDRGKNFEWWLDLENKRALAFIRRPGDLVADECDGARGARLIIPNTLIFQDRDALEIPEWQRSRTIHPASDEHYQFQVSDPEQSPCSCS